MVPFFPLLVSLTGTTATCILPAKEWSEAMRTLWLHFAQQALEDGTDGDD